MSRGKSITENFKNKGTVHQLANFLWQWQAERNSTQAIPFSFEEPLLSQGIEEQQPAE